MEKNFELSLPKQALGRAARQEGFEHMLDLLPGLSFPPSWVGQPSEGGRADGQGQARFPGPQAVAAE